MNFDDNSFPRAQAHVRRAGTARVCTDLARRSKRRFVAVAMILVAALPASAQHDDPAFPAADGLLAAVRARLPQEPLGIHGQLIVRSPRLEKRIRLNVDVELDWGHPQPVSSYTVRDYFGAPLQRLTVKHQSTEDPHYTFASGPAMTNAALPDLSTAIQGTDVSWLDLNLAYLWWPSGETVGVDTILGQNCYMLELPAPQRSQAGYGRVKLWISTKSMMLLRAEAYDAGGTLKRRVALKSFKKIGDQWIAKRIDVTSHPSGRRTQFLVRDVTGRRRGAD